MKNISVNNETTDEEKKVQFHLHLSKKSEFITLYSFWKWGTVEPIAPGPEKIPPGATSCAGLLYRINISLVHAFKGISTESGNDQCSPIISTCSHNRNILLFLSTTVFFIQIFTERRGRVVKTRPGFKSRRRVRLPWMGVFVGLLSTS
jgi:hypothetical protein